MTVVREWGEKAFIREVLADYAGTARPDTIEDCVVIDPERLFGAAGAPLIVYSMDHPSRIDRPLPDGLQWRFYGRWLAACTCNDVLAMGAGPHGFSLDLALPADTEVTVVTDLYAGIHDVLGAYGAAFEGGNIDINCQYETVAMCWGTVPRAGVIRRRGARPGDYIAVTTELGVGWASYLLRKAGRFDRLSEPARTALEQYNLLPLAPHRAIVEVAEQLPGAITSGMDLSDGLAEFLHTIGEVSSLGTVVEQQWLPGSWLLTECADLIGVPAAALAFEYGYDLPRAHGYTVAPERWSEVADVFAAHGWPLFRVGTVMREPGSRWVPESAHPRTLPLLWDDKCRRDQAVPDWWAMVGRLFD